MHNWIYAHSFCRSSRYLTFADKILQSGVRGEKLQLKIFLFNTLTSVKTGFTYIYTTEKT